MFMLLMKPSSVLVKFIAPGSGVQVLKRGQYGHIYLGECEMHVYYVHEALIHDTPWQVQTSMGYGTQ